ncbi:MAG: 4Fe-4S binding protein [Kiritimatiellia bacterium]
MRKLRILRLLLAAFSLLALTACFLDFTGLAAAWFGWLPRLQFGPSVLALSVATVVAILAVTFTVGRVYCSVLCPLGVFQDILIGVRRLCRAPFRPAAPSPVKEAARFGFLALFLGGGFLGLHFVWLEPYAIYGRAVSACLAPLYRMGNNQLAAWAERHANDAFHAVEVVFPAVSVMAVSAGFLVLIAALAVWKGRFWCNAVCPVGTLLGYAAKVAAMKPRLDMGKCVTCRQCERVCKARCIDVAAGKVDLTKCVACFDCVAVCRKGALTWSK